MLKSMPLKFEISIVELTFFFDKEFSGKDYVFALLQLKSKQFLVIVTQAILLKYSLMKKMLEKFPSLCFGHLMRLCVLRQCFCDRFRIQFHLILRVYTSEHEPKYLPPAPPGSGTR